MTDRSDLHKRLRAEARSPYRPLRRFIYFALAGSGLIGAIVFLCQLLAGKGELELLLPNLALQIGAFTLFFLLIQRDRDS